MIKLESNIRKIYANSFLTNFVFFLPILVLFWQENGLSFTQIMSLQAIFAMALIVFELPTGYIADVYGRKLSLLISIIFLGASSFVYATSHSFTFFVIGEIFWALGFSLTSGTDSAFVYDTLIALKRQKHFKKTIGNVLFISSFAAAVGSIIGGFIGDYSFRMAFLAFIPISLVALLIATTYKEPPRKKMVYEKGHFHAFVKIIKFAFIKNLELRWLIIYFALVSVIGHTAFWVFQPYFVLIGLKISHIGVVFALLLIVTALSSKFAYKIEAFIGKRLSLLSLPFISAVALILMAKFISPFSIVFVAALSFVFGYSIPLVHDYINKIVWSDKRATVISLNNIGASFLFAISAPFIGKAVDQIGITQTLHYLGMLGLAFGIIIMFFLNRNKVI